MTAKNHFDGEIYSAEFAAKNPVLPNSDMDWVKEFRRSSFNQFEEVGIPGPKVEEWKYTNLNGLNTQIYGISAENSPEITERLSETSFANIAGSKVVFVDGYFNSEASKIDSASGVNVVNLNDYVKNNPDEAQELFSGQRDENSLGHLNMALMTGGYVINIDNDVKLAEAIEIIHVATDHSSAKALRTRNFIQLGDSSEAQIIESFVGDNNLDYWRQNISNISLGKNASLEIYQFQNEGDSAIHMGETGVTLLQDATFRHYSLNLGGKLSRTEIKPTLNGIHGNVELRGAFMGRDGNAHDVMTHMKHMVPECNSDQIYRGVLDSNGKSAFQGKVYVAQDAQLTNADQSNKNLILNRNAEANSKPELLIYADDVKCSHGATVGELDQEALFYLKSRGLDDAAAKALLIEAFINEVYEDLNPGPIKEKYIELAGSWLSKGA